jgi:hypothetical protein
VFNSFIQAQIIPLESGVHFNNVSNMTTGVVAIMPWGVFGSI